MVPILNYDQTPTQTKQEDKTKRQTQKQMSDKKESDSCFC